VRALVSLLLVVIVAGCGMSVPDTHESTAVDPANAALPTDVPDYVPLGAKVTGRTQDGDTLVIVMETINGLRSPLQFYRAKLPELGWTIEFDEATDTHGRLRARKWLRTMEITVKGLPAAAGSTIELLVED
jgi:hypothetical protein